MLTNFEVRLAKEMNLLNEKLSASGLESIDVKILAPDNRKHSAWVGGSILGDVLSQELRSTEYVQMSNSVM